MIGSTELFMICVVCAGVLYSVAAAVLSAKGAARRARHEAENEEE